MSLVSTSVMSLKKPLVIWLVVSDSKLGTKLVNNVASSMGTMGSVTSISLVRPCTSSYVE